MFSVSKGRKWEERGGKGRKGKKRKEKGRKGEERREKKRKGEEKRGRRKRRIRRIGGLRVSVVGLAEGDISVVMNVAYGYQTC